MPFTVGHTPWNKGKELPRCPSRFRRQW